MRPAVKQALVLGLIIGVLVSMVFWSVSDGDPRCLILIPLVPIIAAATQMIKPGDEE